MRRALWLPLVLLLSGGAQFEFAEPAAAQERAQSRRGRRGRRGRASRGERPQEQRPSSRQPQEVSRFQEAAEERRVALGEDAEASPEAVAATSAASAGATLDALDAHSARQRQALIEEMLAEREGWVIERRAEAIGLLERFVADEAPEAPEMPDALLRLGELRWEDARTTYLAAFGVWQEADADSRGEAPRPDYRQALELYERLVSDYPAFERRDLVRYMMAYALVELDRSDEALMQYRQILAEHPESRFVPDAHFALAESAFGGASFQAALGEFEAVMEHRESQLYNLSLFKSAWCLWRLGDSDAAALRFRQVLDLHGAASMSDAQRQRLRELQDEALDYLIQVFVEDEGNSAADVFAFLEEIGGERYGRRVLERLSGTFMGQSRYAKAIEAFDLLLEMDPLAARAPGWQRDIVRANDNLGDRRAVGAALRALTENYAEGSDWARQQEPAVVAAAAAEAETMLRRQALRAHEAGQREGQLPRLEEAVELYGIYLEHYPDADSAYELRFYQAEILFHRLERFDEAGEAYLAAVQQRPEGEYNRDALYNAIGAFERIREGELARCAEQSAAAAGASTAADSTAEAANAEAGEGEGTDPPSASEAADDGCQGESENDRRFGEAMEQYVALFPDDPDLPEILYRQGRLYYDRQVFDPAVRLFGQLLEGFPESTYAVSAGELILESFHRAEDYENIERWARRLKDAPAFAPADSQARLDALIVQSMFRLGEQRAERGQHSEAAEAYLRAASEFPEDARAKQALYNAGLEYQRGGDLPGAGAAYERLIEEHPGSEVGALGAWAGAQMYESIAHFGEAARFYEAYGTRFPEAEKAEEALYNAVLLRVTNGDNSEAIELAQRYLETHRRGDARDDVTFLLGRAQEASARWRDAAGTYRDYVRRSRNLDRKVEAQTRVALVLAQAGDDEGAAAALEKAVRLGRRHRRRLTEGLYFAAQARYLQGDAVLRRYEAIAIAGDSEGLRERLQEKSELLREAAEIYADVVGFNVAEWITASLYQIGRSYELFAEALREFELPEGLNEEEEQAYLDQLAMFIIPMEERALDAYAGGYQRAVELRIYNRWTASLREALTRLNDIEFPPLRESGGSVQESTPLAPPAYLPGLDRGGEE